MKITLKDGSIKEYAEAMSAYDIARDISEGLARVATAGEVDGEVVDLRTVIDKDSELNILTFNDDKGKGAHHERYNGKNRRNDDFLHFVSPPLSWPVPIRLVSMARLPSLAIR